MGTSFARIVNEVGDKDIEQGDQEGISAV